MQNKFFLILLFFTCSCAHSSSPKKYDRKLFKHWVDYDGDCKNRRAEILKQRSLIPVTYNIRKNKKQCSVKDGKWDDYYYPEVHLDASKVDIDHIVSLKHAWDNGASLWSKKKREKFANDPENLAITKRTYNRKKGALTPLSWSPRHKDYACKYLQQWIYIKRKYKLSINSKVVEYLKQMNCSQK